MNQKILFYYHHFGGLGHGTRILSLCKTIKVNNPACRLVVINSGPPQPELGIERYARVINLPFFTAKSGLFSGLNSMGSTESTFRKRKMIIERVARIFSPDIAIFEHFPFGRYELLMEIVPFIEDLRNRRTMIYSSVRDIIVQKINEKQLDNLLDLFNGVLIHSNMEEGFITSFEKTKKLQEKMIFTGRIFKKQKDELLPKNRIRKQLDITNKKLIVAGIGGGIDGLEILKDIIDLKIDLEKTLSAGILLLISTGPSIEDKKFTELKNQAKTKKDILITRFNPNYIDYINAADLAISMGGYNSVNDALLTGTKTIIVPRESDEEQPIRAKLFSDALYSFPSKKFKNKKETINMLVDVLSKENSKPRTAGSNNQFLKIMQNIGTLKLLKIRLTNECYCNCDMCTWIKEPKKALSLDSVKAIVRDAKKLGVEVINLTGGEPTIHNNFKDIFEYIKGQNMEISLSTNLGFNNDILDFIITNQVNHLDFSLDFNNPLEFDKARAKPGLFNRIEKNISKLNRLLPDCNLYLNFTVRRDNFRQAPDIVDFCRKHQIHSIEFHLVQKNKNNERYVKDLLLDKQNLKDFYFEVVPLILKKANREVDVRICPSISELDGLPTSSKILKILLLKDQLYDKWTQRLSDLYCNGKNLTSKNRDGNLTPSCDFEKNLRINMDGEYSPCCTYDESNQFSNIKEKNLFDLWINHSYNSKPFPFERCSSCLENDLLF